MRPILERDGARRHHQMPDLILKPGKERSLRRRHPWVYSTAVAKVQGAVAPGDTVAVRASDGQFLAWAAYSPASQIRARVWSFEQSAQIDADWFEARLRSAIMRRRHLKERSTALRLVFGEADGLPGLVVDQYGDWLVAQSLAAGVERFKPIWAEALLRITGLGHLYERSDAAVREREGLPQHAGPLLGDPPTGPIEVIEDGVRYGVDIVSGHKTGFYVDQRENRLRVAELVRQQCAEGRQPRVLNCFSYTGGFSLAALRAGAEQVISVDSSADALAQARNNAALNGLSEAAFQTRQAKVQEVLREYLSSGELFDLVILDPPKFAPSAQHLEAASRAYKDLNLRGMRLVRPGGYLLTFSCSGAMSVELFQKVVAGAAVDAGDDWLMIERLAAGIDHPMNLMHPEGEYLKGLLLQRI